MAGRQCRPPIARLGEWLAVAAFLARPRWAERVAPNPDRAAGAVNASPPPSRPMGGRH